MSQVATRLKEVREEKNFTIEAVAGKTGITIDELQAFEEGSKLPDAGVLMQLSKVYECLSTAFYIQVMKCLNMMRVRRCMPM